MARLRGDFGDGHEVHFFDSTTHPLGDPSLRVPEMTHDPHRWFRLMKQAEEAEASGEAAE